VGISEAPIQWPIGEKGGKPDLVVYRGLLRALEANEQPVAMPGRWASMCDGSNGDAKGSGTGRSTARSHEAVANDPSHPVGYIQAAAPGLGKTTS